MFNCYEPDIRCGSGFCREIKWETLKQCLSCMAEYTELRNTHARARLGYVRDS